MRSGGAGRPLYVTSIEPDTGTVTVGPAETLRRGVLFASAVNWLSGESPRGPVRADARIRYKSRDEPAWITPVKSGARIEFDRPQRAVTPGQAVVFYADDEVLGGGTIELVESALHSNAAVAAAV